MVLIKSVFVFSFLISCVSTALNNTSPCPNLFVYEQNTSVSNRWYGIVTLLSDTELEGVWLRLTFDRQLQQIGNWFGEVKANRENNEFVITNKNYKLKADTPYLIRFYAQYDESRPVPKLVSIVINSQQVCPEENLNTRTTVISSFQGSGPSTVKPSTARQPDNPLQISDDDDYFIGDFGIINREQPPAPSPSQSSLGECGTVTAQRKVLSGHETGAGEFPWHADIYHISSVDLVLVGGGTLISKNYVLTAGHCLHTDPSTNIFPDELLIYLGKHNLRSFSGLGVQDRRVTDIVFHSQFNSTTSAHNMAVLKMNVPVTVTDHVRPICLWQGETVDREGVIVGWGVDAVGKLYSQLTRGEMRIVSKKLCSPITYETFCTTYRSATAVCNADAGGGFFSTRRGVWYLRGVLSVDQKGTKCDPFKYTIVTDITPYLQWIKFFI